MLFSSGCLFLVPLSLSPVLCLLHFLLLPQKMQAFMILACQQSCGNCCQVCMPAGTSRCCLALVLTSDALQVVTEAHASTDLAGGPTQDPDRASPSSALAPTAPLRHPKTSCPEPSLPAQAVIRVSANYMGCK